MMKRLVPLLLFLSSASLLQAQETSKPEEVYLNIYPQGPSEPAMKYRLLPDVSDETPGNAATIYLMAFDMANAQISALKSTDDFDQLRNASPSDLSESKAAAFLDPYARVFEVLAVAGRRTNCDWDPPLQEQGFRAPLNYLNTARVAADVLSVKIKLDIKQHHFEDAVDSLRTGLALADKLDRKSIIVQLLVATGLRAEFLNNIRALIQVQGAPNMYWALANLPPAGNHRVAVAQMELAELFFTYPGLRHPEQLSAKESREFMENLRSLGGGVAGYPELLFGMIRDYPKAKKYLMDRGMSAEQVNSLPANSVVLAHDVAEYNEQTDAFAKWAGLPEWQAELGLRREEERFARADRSSNPLLSLVPSFFRFVQTLARADRARAMIEIVEAIRAYAASHGSMPQSLDDLSPEMPAPIDPMLGKPFGYDVKGDTATLRATAPEGEAANYGAVYHITLVH